MAITHVGVGAQAASTTSPISVPLPAGIAENDLLWMIVAGRPAEALGSNDTVTIDAGAAGWAQLGATSYQLTPAATELSVQVWTKLAGGSEADPSLGIGTSLAQSSSGFSGQIGASRGVDLSTPSDATPVTSGSGAAPTWTPTGIATITNAAVVLSIVASADDNALALNVDQGFTAVMSGADYDTNVGSDHAVAVAYKEIVSPGLVTMPEWVETVNGNDAWAGITIALQPAGGAAAGRGRQPTRARGALINTTFY